MAPSRTHHQDVHSVGSRSYSHATMSSSSNQFSRELRLASPEPPLHLLIIGGGLCGLSAAISARLAGQHATVLESVSAFREVGAGLQVTPNGTRLLRAWGLADVLGPKAAIPEFFRMYRYTGKVLAERTMYSSEIGGLYKAPIWCLHRSDLQLAMAERAKELGAVVRLGCKVTGVDAGEERRQNEQVAGMSVSLEGGEVVRGDIVLAADGVWSQTRQELIGINIQPKPTGDLAYRILLDREKIRDDKLRAWLDNPGINIWVGPEMHAVGYSIKGGRWLNLVLLVKDNLPEGVMKAEGNLAEMRALFQEWDPILTRFLEHVEKVEKWRLNYRKVENIHLSIEEIIAQLKTDVFTSRAPSVLEIRLRNFFVGGRLCPSNAALHGARCEFLARRRRYDWRPAFQDPAQGSDLRRDDHV